MNRNRTILVAFLAGVLAVASAKDAPVFKASATDGKTYRTEAFLKKPAILVFLNAKCPHSKMATPDLNKLRKQLAGKVQLIAVTNLDLEGAKKFVKEIKAEFPLIADSDGKIVKSFGGKFSLDFTVVSGKEKKVIYPKVWEGYSEAWVKEALASLPNGKTAFDQMDFKYLPDDRQSGCQF